MTGRLHGKVAMITGAGRGIGRAIALKFAREGASLALNDLDGEPLEAVAAEAEAAGARTAVLAGDVVARDFGERFIDLATSRLGGLDILVNNAGYTWDGVIQRMTDEQWQAILDVP